MPKAELHLHLDGSLRVETALELARSRGVDAPLSYGAMFEALVAPARLASQAELLTRFELPIALLQDAEALEQVTSELVETKAAEGVRYVEIRWGPALHLERGMALADGIAAVCRGARDAADRTGITVRLICTALRSHDPGANVHLAETAAGFRDQGLTGWDLAGPEAAWPDPLRFATAFEAARAGGLRITLHAGEWGGAAQVRRALQLDPERIAHGPGAIDDPDLMAELIRREVTLDLCPTSNLQAGLVPSIGAHPLARLQRAGVPVTLSTDGSTVSDILLSEEYVRAVEEIGLTLPELWTINMHALDVAFADPSAIAPLRASFERWASIVPELDGPA
jgi:adenosine deaminase